MIGLLWPDQPDATARHNLADTVYQVRKALGESAVRSEGEQVRLNSQLIAADVPEFDAAIAADDPARAIELYRGPFLDGFHLPGAPVEFETWIDGERARLGFEYEKALEAVAEAAEADGDLVQAVDAWRRLMRHDPANSRVAVRLMQALAGAGDPANAIQFAGEHERYLRKELDLDLSDAVRELVEVLRNESAARTSVGPIASPPSTGGEGPTSARAESEPVAESQSSSPAIDIQRASRLGWRLLLPLALLLALAYAGVGVLRNSSWAGGALPEIHSLAVLPLHDLSTNGGEPYLADGLTDALIGELGQLSALDKVIARRTAMQYRDDDRSISEIAAELEVDAIVEGTVFRADDQVRITLHLVHGPADWVLWSRAYDGRQSDLISLQKRVSRDVADGVQLALTPAEQDRLVKAAYAPDPQAYEAYLKGKHHFYRWGDRDAPAAVGHYERAIEIDSSYAPAHAALAEICIMAGPLNLRSAWTVDDCEAMARRAIRLDPELAEGVAGHVAAQVSREVMYAWVAPRLGVAAAGPVEEPAFAPIPPAELSVRRACRTGSDRRR